MRLPLLLTLAVPLYAQTDPLVDASEAESGGAPKPASVSPLLHTPDRRVEGADWAALVGSSGRFLALEHGFRLLTEPGTRSGLRGAFFPNYGRSASNLHGWADGDEFYVNYVGHPMQGSVAGFLWIQNDRPYREAEFGRDPLYWKSRLRAAAFAWAYSEQFEIGTLSEASIGAIQASFPQQGFVDHVVTPVVGLGWIVAEDAIDRFLIERLEGATGNRFLRLMSRSALNPCRTFANVLQGHAPWNRETRSGIMSFVPAEKRGLTASSRARPAREVPDVPGPAPFEFAMTFQPARFLGGGNIVCLGGGGTAAFRLSPSWQFVVDVNGCKMLGLEENLSGDSLTYVAGPRFRTRDWGRWSASLQFLVGGNKLTEERMFPQTKKLLEMAAARDPRALPPAHTDYTEETVADGFAVSSGAGVSYKLNPALTLRLAELAYQHAWTAPLRGRSFSDTVKFSSGLVLRIGTW